MLSSSVLDSSKQTFANEKNSWWLPSLSEIFPWFRMQVCTLPSPQEYSQCHTLPWRFPSHRQWLWHCALQQAGCFLLAGIGHPVSRQQVAALHHWGWPSLGAKPLHGYCHCVIQGPRIVWIVSSWKFAWKGQAAGLGANISWESALLLWNSPSLCVQFQP